MQITSLFLLFGVLNTSQAVSLPVETFDEIAVNTFWNELYANGGWSLYCGYQFGRTDDQSDGRYFVIEHIYPVSWMLKHMKCNSRRQCRLSDKSRYTKMEADMHNLYPVWQEVDVIRRDTIYGMVEGEDWRYENCDFERRSGVTEPRPIARGNIARAIFYMHSQYGVPIDNKMLQSLKGWNRDDPPSKQEMLRNNLIEELQGNRNPYIDNPALAEQISDKWIAEE
ncbi:MAG: endonuclease [Proteobacteria bacterium]|nr:endonuclease [Pseudomonadota bacterium]